MHKWWGARLHHLSKRACHGSSPPTANIGLMRLWQGFSSSSGVRFGKRGKLTCIFMLPIRIVSNSLSSFAGFRTPMKRTKPYLLPDRFLLGATNTSHTLSYLWKTGQSSFSEKLSGKLVKKKWVISPPLGAGLLLLRSPCRRCSDS